MINWKDIDYLKGGNSVQKRAFKVIEKLNILDHLKRWNPILVGTIPIEINIIDSDLDIICSVNEFNEFKESVERFFSDLDGFKSEEIVRNGKKVFTANFFYEGFEFEIYGEDLATERQNAYRHMVIEHRLLLEKGEEFKKEIIELKESGIKTEPAFAKLLNLSGNPYEALLELE